MSPIGTNPLHVDGTPPFAVVDGEPRFFTAEPSTDLRNFDHLWTPPDAELVVTDVDGAEKALAAPGPVGVEAFESHEPVGAPWTPPRDVVKILDRRAIRLNQLRTYACSYFSVLNAAKATFGYEPTYQEGVDGYSLAQDLDEWAGREPTYFGSSGNGACRAARQRGLVRSWQYLPVAEHCVAALLYNQAVMWPSVWTTGMAYPNRSNVMSPTGGEYGGHLVSIFAWIGPMSLVGVDNSWGLWGNDGVAYMPLSEFVWKWQQWREAIVPFFVS